MPALNFKTRFAEAVEWGAKVETIRARRKRPIKVGDRLYLYTGQRTKSCRKLGEGRCHTIKSVCIWPDSIVIEGVKIPWGWHADCFARRDGFEDWPEMRDWFVGERGLPFRGVLIKWRKES